MMFLAMVCAITIMRRTEWSVYFWLRPNGRAVFHFERRATPMRYLYFSIALGVAACLGCGGASRPEDRMLVGLSKEAPNAAQGPGKEEAGDEKPATEAPRKIIYTAQIELIADDFDKIEQELDQLVKDHEAYVAKSDTHGSPGVPRSGTWTIRVPVKH